MISKELRLEGKAALVAGAGRDWQGELASYLAEAGADVALAADDEKQIEAAVRGVEKYGRQALAFPTEMSRYASIEKTTAAIIEKWGKIDILVNNMDLMFAKPFLDIVEDEWHRVMDANLTQVFLFTQAVGKHMIERKKGSIINMSSILAERGLPNGVAYCAAKGAIGQLTKALALEWAREGIRVNSIGVGWDSDLLKTEKGPSPLSRYISVHRFCRPEDVGGLLVFLASDAASYGTGQTYYLSGGVMAHG